MLFRKSLLAILLLKSVLPPVDALAQETTGTAPGEQPPNVLIIFTDDLGYGDISSFSDALKVKTPNIDRLATEGTRFTQFYVAAPICSPSRASLLSGMFAPETGLTSFLHERVGNKESDQDDFMDSSLAHMPQAFKAAGYATGHIGKWHLGGGRDVDNAPRIGAYGYDEAYSTWEGPKLDRDPTLGTNHAPWDKERMDPGQVERWNRTRHMVDKTLDFFKRHEGKPTFVTLWPDDLHLPFRPSPLMRVKHGGQPDKDNSIENFYGVLEAYDRKIGHLLDGLKEQGMEENTIVIFTGDNGPAPHYEQKRTDGLRGMKNSLYEGGIRQPFLIRWPGKIPAGKENSETVLSAVDLLPTLASMAGVELRATAKEKMDGVDMSAALKGEPVRRKQALLYEFGRTPRVPRAKEKGRSPALAIRKGNFKLLVDHDNTNHELYNIAKDRSETTNLADRRTTLTQQLARQVIDWSKTLPHRQHPFPAE